MQDHHSGVRELASIFTGIALIFGLLLLDDRREALRYLQLGWITAFLLTGVIGVREFLTGEHLFGYMLGRRRGATTGRLRVYLGIRTRTLGPWSRCWQWGSSNLAGHCGFHG